MFRRIVLAALVAAGVVIGVAGPAGAHVTVGADGAKPGGFAVITFRVPNEESDAKTVGLKVQLPADHPIAFVSVQPKPGWDATTETTRLDTPLEAHGGQIDEAVSEVTWTGGEIPSGGFDEFKIQAGPLPEGVDALTFKAIQTYEDADGTTHDVAWIQEPGDDGAEPEHPAPVLELTGASADDHGSGDAAAPTVTATDDGDSGGATNGGFVIFAMAFGASGLALAVVALVMAVAARHKVGLIAEQAGIDDKS